MTGALREIYVRYWNVTTMTGALLEDLCTLLKCDNNDGCFVWRFMYFIEMRQQWRVLCMKIYVLYWNATTMTGALREDLYTLLKCDNNDGCFAWRFIYFIEMRQQWRVLCMKIYILYLNATTMTGALREDLYTLLKCDNDGCFAWRFMYFIEMWQQWRVLCVNIYVLLYVNDSPFLPTWCTNSSF